VVTWYARVIATTVRKRDEHSSSVNVNATSAGVRLRDDENNVTAVTCCRIVLVRSTFRSFFFLFVVSKRKCSSIADGNSRFKRSRGKKEMMSDRNDMDCERMV